MDRPPRDLSPDDRLRHEVAELLISPSPTRERLCGTCYVARDIEDPLAAIEAALVATIEAEPVEAKVKAAIRSGKFEPGLMINGGVDAVYVAAHEAGVISDTELAIIQHKGELRDKVIRVDDFEYDLGLREALSDVSPADQDLRRKAA